MPKIVDHQLRRTLIAEQALTQFSAQGYASLSMRRLASTIGVTTGMLYHYFPSKQSLLSEAFLQMRTKDIELVQQLIMEQRVKLSQSKNQQGAVSLLAIFVSEHSERLSGLIRIGLDVRRVEPNNPTLDETISGYRVALRRIFGVDEVAAQAALWLLFGCLTEVSLGGEVNSDVLNYALSSLLCPLSQLTESV